jgi:glycosyltransferase involved in cell wall biosynthesis
VDLIIKTLEGLKNVFLLIVGDGEENEELSKLASKLKIDYKITGFIEDQDELFKIYYAGALLVLPSYNEPWGLVVNEAMAAGLPVIVSNESGCSLDLVKDGENGFILSDLENPEILRNLIIKTLENKENFSKKSSEIIDNWTFEKSRESFENLLKAISV